MPAPPACPGCHHLRPLCTAGRRRGGAVAVRSGCGLHASPEGARQVLLRGASSETRSRRIENQNTQSGRPQGEGIALLRWWVPPPSAGPAAAQRGPVLRTHWQKQRAGSRRCCRSCWPKGLNKREREGWGKCEVLGHRRRMLTAMWRPPPHRHPSFLQPQSAQAQLGCQPHG